MISPMIGLSRTMVLGLSMFAPLVADAQADAPLATAPSLNWKWRDLDLHLGPQEALTLESEPL